MYSRNTAMEPEDRRLPQDVKPLHYAIKLYDLHLKEDDWTYKGHVDIQVAVRKKTECITLNAHKLRNVSVNIASVCGAAIGHVTEDEDTQRLLIHLDKEIAASSQPVHLSVDYDATIDGSLTGFYRSREVSTKTDDAARYIFTTQFQPSDARRAFPCFDEPDFKATFAFSIEVANGLKVISNMPEKSSVPSERDQSCQIVSFERTPVMSTYLLAWGIGDLRYVETCILRRHSREPLTIRVYTSPSSLQHAKFPLDLASKVIDYFSQTFGIDYPLPKLDLLSVTEMSDDAMENWGLAIFRSTTLLLDESTAEPGVRTRVAYIIAHELAHQWFGNLVTPFWWDELWLNEGFATWAGWDCLDFIYPEWDVWGQFVADDMQEAFELDQLPSSHPVQVPVLDGLEVDSIFDSISYLKGASIIRMLAAHLGREKFLAGVSNYLKAHTYQNAVGDSLWSALEEASGLDVASLVKPWIKTAGFPVISVKIEGEAKLLLEQSPMLSSDDRTLWAVPMVIRTTDSTVTQVLDTKSTVVDISGALVKINSNQGGFFRINLEKQTLLDMSKSLHALSASDKAGILGDAMSMAFVGRCTLTSTVLTLLESFSADADFVVWTSILSCLDQISSVFSSDSEALEGLDAFTRKIVGHRASSLGWTYDQDESYNTQRLRPLLLTAAGLSDHEEIVARALELFEAIQTGQGVTVHPFLRQTVFEIAVSENGIEAVKFLQELYQATDPPHEREAIVNAMGNISDEDEARQCLFSAFSGPMAAQDLETFAVALANNPAVPGVVWNFIREEWQLVCDRLAGSMAIFEPFVRRCLQTLNEENDVEDVKAFFADKDTQGYGRGLTVALDFVRANAAYKNRDLGVVREWLRENGYLDE